jgi:hypothetical protein
LTRRRIDPTNARLLEVAYAATGSKLKAARVAALVTTWAMTRNKLGRDPTVIEYAREWGEDRTTVYKQLDLMRQVFPKASDPNDVLRLVDEQLGRELPGKVA